MATRRMRLLPVSALRGSLCLLRAGAAARALPAAAAPRRAFASPPAISDPASEAAAAAAAAPTGPAASTPQPSAHAKPAASPVWSRLTAFLTGVGVSSGLFFYSLSDDLARSNAAVDASLAAFKRDATATNAELRTRVATLEHVVASLKQ